MATLPVFLIRRPNNSNVDINEREEKKEKLLMYPFRKCPPIVNDQQVVLVKINDI